MSVHLTGTETANTVRTGQFDLMRNAVQVALTHREIALAYGRPGTGKTFAAHVVTREVVDELADSTGRFRIESVQVPRSRSPRTLYAAWVSALTGAAVVKGSEYELAQILVELLSDGRTVTIVDEAQHLGTDGLEQLRWVFDRIDGNTPLVVVGSSDLSAILHGSPQLRSRVARPVHFHEIAPDDLNATLAAYHPMFDGADPLVLRRLDASFAHRNFRHWARILQAALRVADALDHPGPIDDRIAGVVLTELAGWR